MNTFLSTKMGEVLAFARVGIDTLRKGKEGFLKILSIDDMDELTAAFEDFEKRILEVAAQENSTEDVEKSAKETHEKVSSMRDTYIDGEWSKDSEVLEWMGFYTGAALVHWRLITGAAKSLKHTELEKLSHDASTFYSSLFSSDEKFLEKIGEKGVS